MIVDISNGHSIDGFYQGTLGSQPGPEIFHPFGSSVTCSLFWGLDSDIRPHDIIGKFAEWYTSSRIVPEISIGVALIASIKYSSPGPDFFQPLTKFTTHKIYLLINSVKFYLMYKVTVSNNTTLNCYQFL